MESLDDNMTTIDSWFGTGFYIDITPVRWTNMMLGPAQQ